MNFSWVFTLGFSDFLENQSEYRHSQDPSSLGLNQRGQYDQGYLTVFDLMTHEENTEGSDMLQYSLVSLAGSNTASLVSDQYVSLDHSP